MLASPALAGCGLAKIAELPVTMQGLTPTVSVKIDGGEAKMIADSGAFFSSITPQAARRLGLKIAARSGATLEGAGGEADAGLAQAKTFEVLGFTLHNADFLMTAPQLPADGLLGENMLGLADTEFDLADGVIRLMKPTGCEKTALAYWATDRPYSAIDIYTISRQSDSIRGTVKVNGVSIRAQFDTGAPRTIVSLKAAKAAGVNLADPRVKPGGVSGGIGLGEYETWIAPVTSFEIGGEAIKNTSLRIGDIRLDGADMLVGADFFLSHRVFVSKSQARLYFTYNGGPVFDLGDANRPAATAVTTAAAAGAEKPSDAAGFSRRAAAFAARADYDSAISDYASAIALAPGDPQPLVERGRLYWRQGQPMMAAADFEAALKLKPDDVTALLARGELRLARRDTAGAAADFDAAIKADPSQALPVAQRYVSFDRFADAVARYDAWIATHPKDAEMASVLNNRCWVRALWGQELDKAEADCDAALRLAPGAASILDSRGLVHLRRGEADKAIADYNGALEQTRHDPWSLYGRGLAQLKKGRKAQGDADIAAAAAIEPGLPDRFKQLGIAP
ncbi:MAG TPA: tetratricopeptide repeat protein [Caulobacteraceae bacterium]